MPTIIGFTDANTKALENGESLFNDHSSTGINNSIIGLELKLNIENGNQKTHKASLTFDANEMKERIPPEYKETELGIYLRFPTAGIGIANRFHSVKRSKGLDFIYEILRHIEPDIEELFLGADR